ncbi:MAG: SDR family oxidoreductase [Candidatus Sulfomarinibacteraceae bacterium]
MRDEVGIITGAASGIGRHFAGEMARRGYRLVLADIAFARLREAFSESDDLRLFELDIRDREAWGRLFAEVEGRFGRLDYLFNIAGVHQPAYTADATLDEVDLHLDVNAKGTMYGTVLAVRHMTRQGFGQVVNVASLTGVAPITGLDLYSASKFAIRGFSLAAAHGLQGTGVTVTVVCPDLVATPMMEHQLDFDASALAFSGSRPLTVEETTRALLRAMEKRPMEIGLPASRRILAKVGNLAPGLATILTRKLTAKGLETMRRMRREREGSKTS